MNNINKHGNGKRVLTVTNLIINTKQQLISINLMSKFVILVYIAFLSLVAATHRRGSNNVPTSSSGSGPTLDQAKAKLDNLNQIIAGTSIYPSMLFNSNNGGTANISLSTTNSLALSFAQENYFPDNRASEVSQKVTDNAFGSTSLNESGFKTIFVEVSKLLANYIEYTLIPQIKSTSSFLKSNQWLKN